MPISYGRSTEMGIDKFLQLMLNTWHADYTYTKSWNTTPLQANMDPENGPLPSGCQGPC